MVTGSPVHVRNVYRTAMPPAVANPNPDRPRRGASAPTTALVQREASSDEEAAPAAVPAAPMAAQDSAAAASQPHCHTGSAKTQERPASSHQSLSYLSLLSMFAVVRVWHLALDTRGLLWIQWIRI